MTMMEMLFPVFCHGHLWQSFCSFVKAPLFECAIDIVLVLNAAVVGIQSWCELSSNPNVPIDEQRWEGSIDTMWELHEAIFTAIYVLEALAKIAVLGWKSYSKQMRNMFDFLVTVLAVTTSTVHHLNNCSDSRLVRMVITARVLRLLKQFQLMGEVTAKILPAARGMLGLLFLLLYFYAALGMQLYGGLISRNPDDKVAHLLLGSDFAESNYWANNFNDMLSGINVRCHINASVLNFVLMIS